MPRLLIRDAHEGATRLSLSRGTRVNLYTFKGTNLRLQAGKEDPVEFDSSLALPGGIEGVVVSGKGLPWQ